MNISILSNSKKNTGGVERFSLYLQNCLQNYGHVVTIFSIEDLSPAKQALIKASRYLGLEIVVLGFFLGEGVRKQKHDIVVTNGLLGWSLTNMKVINIQHGTFARGAIRGHKNKRGIKFFIKRYVWSFFEKLAAGRATRCVAVSEETRESVIELYGVSAVDVVPNGIDTNIFKPMDQRVARKKLGLPENKKVVFFASRLGVQKGSSLIIAVAKKVALTLTDVVVVGASFGQSFPNECAIISLEDISYETLVYAYSAADIFLLPSNHEGCSLALLEAMACGIPFLASPVGLVPELKKKGLFLDCIIEKQDPDAYLAGINMLLGKTESQRELLSKQLREYIVSTHTLELFGRGYQKLITEIA